MHYRTTSLILLVVKSAKHFSGNRMDALYLDNLDLHILTLDGKIKTRRSRLATRNSSFPISYRYSVEIRIQQMVSRFV